MSDQPATPPVDDDAEPADAGADHSVPTDLAQLHEIEEWEAAVKAQGGGE